MVIMYTTKRFMQLKISLQLSNQNESFTKVEMGK